MLCPALNDGHDVTGSVAVAHDLHGLHFRSAGDVL